MDHGAHCGWRHGSEEAEAAGPAVSIVRATSNTSAMAAGLAPDRRTRPAVRPKALGDAVFN
ncbi:hypothetical protein HMPREF0682_2586 [Propionibacterium acidifaciens F0233]|uniref:Uncharacterized protein n=1 Tax=Propionibacterium acidifaciens F0233 TaxID=553198 RepID=U2S5V9_9ACTN|nr:hypothetical protein HMPREF0682_2586 [Propionibacterium acidifaciens F0233]